MQNRTSQTNATYRAAETVRQFLLSSDTPLNYGSLLLYKGTSQREKNTKYPYERRPRGRAFATASSEHTSISGGSS